ncbi:endonuclease Q family protein [Patescibacteria group bacterium]|nr:endonuclease Q family protein [Patescibacteria group bacterium]MBU4098470.1 endonuclease Q family protein [Patescibacteria group bacterium]
MEFVADLHLHSKYSRAVSPNMTLPIMAAYAVQKGIDILTVADWAHPLWFKEVTAQLKEAGEGVYKLKSQKSKVLLFLSF